MFASTSKVEQPGMKDKDRETLRENRGNLIKNIADPDAVIDLLFARRVFTERMKDDVEAITVNSKKVSKILDLLPKRGAQAFDDFYQILIATENSHAAAFLKPVEGLVEFPPDWSFEDASKEEIQVKPCDKSSDVYIQNWNNPMIYSMKKQPRGRAIIINNKDFKMSVPGDYTRYGTDVDRDRLKVLFEQLFFEVIVYENQKGQDIRDVLEREKMDQYHTTADCFILTILSHGTENGIYGIDGDIVSVEIITGYFTTSSCPNLANKPKIFFIQACRGDNKDLGDTACTGPDTSDGLDSTKDMSLNQPDKKTESSTEHQDTLVAFSTYPSFISMRNTKYGTWYIQAVIWMFKKYSHKEDLLSLLTKVNNAVSKQKAFDQETKLYIRQTANFSSTFLKTFYFFPGCRE